MKLIAFTIKGIEKIASDEIQSVLKDVKILRVEEKAIIFEYPEESVLDIRKLRTVDDVAVYVSDIEMGETVDHENLAKAVGKVELEGARKFLQKFRDIKSSEFSLTVSLPGFENVSSVHFKDYLAEFLSISNKWNYTPKSHEEFDIRLFRGEETILVGVRLFQSPLHRRDYKQNYRRGSLRPTIAAALVRYATHGEKGMLADNFCGSGTILAEAFVLGNEIYGGDIHKGSVHFTHQNLENLDFKDLDRVRVQDATNTEFENDMFDFVVSNLPWGKQIDTGSTRDVFQGALKEYKRILKKDFCMVLLTKHPEIIYTILSDQFPSAKVESFVISLVGQQPTVIKVTSN